LQPLSLQTTFFIIQNPSSNRGLEPENPVSSFAAAEKGKKSRPSFVDRLGSRRSNLGLGSWSQQQFAQSLSPQVRQGKCLAHHQRWNAEFHVLSTVSGASYACPDPLIARFAFPDVNPFVNLDRARLDDLQESILRDVLGTHLYCSRQAPALSNCT